MPVRRVPKRRSGSVAELGLWFEGLSDSESLMVVAECLIGEGAVPNGLMSCLPSAAIAGGFEAITDYAQTELGFRSLEDLRQGILSEEYTPVGLEFCGLDGLPGTAAETAIELVLERTPRPSHDHALALVVDDAKIWGLPGDPTPLDGGRVLVELLTVLAKSTALSVASIFNEFPMRKPHDLQPSDGDTWRDFFVADDLIGSSAVERVLEKAGGSGHRTDRGGLVVSSPQLGGPGTDVAPSAHHLINVLRNQSSTRP